MRVPLYHNALLAPLLPSTCSQHLCPHHGRSLLRHFCARLCRFLPACRLVAHVVSVPLFHGPPRARYPAFPCFGSRQSCDRAPPSHVASLAHCEQGYGYLSYHHRMDVALTRHTATKALGTRNFTLSQRCPRRFPEAVLCELALCKRLSSPRLYQNCLHHHHRSGSSYRLCQAPPPHATPARILRRLSLEFPPHTYQFRLHQHHLHHRHLASLTMLLDDRLQFPSAILQLTSFGSRLALSLHDVYPTTYPPCMSILITICVVLLARLNRTV